MEENSNSAGRGLNGLLEGKGGGILLNVMIVALVLASLLLPPV